MEERRGEIEESREGVAGGEREKEKKNLTTSEEKVDICWVIGFLSSGAIPRCRDFTRKTKR